MRLLLLTYLNKYMKETIGVLLAIVVVSFILCLVMIEGVDKHELVDCLKWEEYQREYPLYTALDWEIEQCLRHDIILN